MRGSEYGEQDRKAAILYEYETFKATEGEQLLDTYLRYIQVINDLKKYGYKKDNCDVNDALGYKKKYVVVTSDPLALVAEKTKVINRKEKVEVQSESKESDDKDISDLKKITALLAKAFNRKKCYLLNDYKDVGKLKVKGDIRVFVGYSKASVAFRIYNKRSCIDYDETFPPVDRIEAIRLFLAYDAHKDFIVFQMDVKTAFLNGILKEEV
nr:retrovirus-related Pol polyprotein from transposon TNT 1-94 [Tanacetum cinerariifolium]